MYAATQLAKGSAGAALIGGVEEANEMLFSVLDRIGALAHDGHPGITLGEGGAVLVAGAGTRKPYGWLAGFGIARDTTATISNYGSDPSVIVRAMHAALEDAGLGAIDAIEAIYVSLNGSLRGDDTEKEALLMFPRADIVRTKHIFGEYAAGGALQIVAALVALDEGRYRNVLVNSISAGGGIVCAVLSREAA
jgi:3-oxoacyl-(acyl-carrier-protein) synthase